MFLFRKVSTLLLDEDRRLRVLQSAPRLLNHSGAGAPPLPVSSAASNSWLYTGAQVTWRGADQDLPSGTVHTCRVDENDTKNKRREMRRFLSFYMRSALHCACVAWCMVCLFLFSVKVGAVEAVHSDGDVEVLFATVRGSSKYMWCTSSFYSSGSMLSEYTANYLFILWFSNRRAFLYDSFFLF